MSLIVAIALMVVLSSVSTGANYLGCFRLDSDSLRTRHQLHRDRSHHRSDWSALTNADCVRECANFPLAATRGVNCSCIHATDLSNAQAIDDSWCRLPCSGAAEQDSCEADECCGGHDDHVHSVYSAGDVDIVGEIEERLKHSLAKKRHLVDLKLTECGSTYQAVKGPDDGNYKFKNSQMSRMPSSSQTECYEQCNSQAWCRSVMFHSLLGCLLYNVSSKEAEIIPNELDTTIHDRKCPGRVHIINDVFNMELASFVIISNRTTAESTHPLDNEVLELDLTTSNHRSDITRKLSVRHDDQYRIETLSGLRALVHSADTGRSDPASECVASHNASIRLSMSGNYLELMEHESLEQLSSNLRQKLSASLHATVHADVDTDDLTACPSLAQSSYRTKSMTSNTEAYTVNMNVPAFHHGRMSFYLRETHQQLVWRATLRLTDYIKVCSDIRLHEFHVSRLLPRSEREYHVLGHVTYTQHTVTSKIVITDASGQIVSVRT